MSPPAPRPSGFSPARRFTWLMSALIAAAAAYAGVALWIDAAHEREALAHRVEETARLAAERTDDYLQRWHAVFDSLADHECLQLRRRESCTGLLGRLQRRFPDLVGIVATDHRGEVIAGGASGPDAAPMPLGGQPYFRALTAGRPRVLLDPRPLPTPGDRAIGIVVARRDDSQRFLGAFGVSTRLSALQAIWGARRPYADVGLLVINAEGRILFAQHEIAHVEGRSARDLGLPAAPPEDPRRADFRFDGTDFLAYRAPVGDGEWSVVAYRRRGTPQDGGTAGLPGYKLFLPLALLAIVGGGLALRGQRIQQRLAVSEEQLQLALARTEQEVAQRTRALAENEARYRALFDRSPNGVVILDREGRIVEFNRNAANQLGYATEDFARLNFGALEAGEGDLSQRLRRLLAERGSDQYETRLQARSGHLVDMLVSVRVIELASGAVILAVLTDLSPIQRIRELQRRLQSIVEASRDAIVLLDDQGTVLYANPGSEALFGLPAADLRGHPVPLRWPAAGLQADGPAAPPVLAALAPERTSPFEVDALHRDGRRIPAELTLASWEEDGRLLYSGILRDMTERRQAQDRLQFTQKMEAVGILAGGIAHDFNNLLAIMLGHGQLICDRTPDNDPVRSSAEKINKAVLKARALIKQLLDFSRASDEAPKVMSLAEEIRDVEALIRSTVPRHVEFGIEVAGSPGAIRAVPHQIQQVFINLINNACDAIGGVRGTVEVRLADETVDTPIDTPDGPVAAGRYLVARVLDSGPGISEAIHNRIFLPFFTTKEVGRGTGLGLAVVRNIMRQSRGHIRVFNRLSGGACFELYFPLVDSVPSPVAAAAPEVAGRGECVLFVDDEPEVVEAYAEYLRRVGFTPRVHDSAAGALDDLERNPAEVRVVVSDLAMPGMDGLELAHAIHRRFPALPVLLLTGRGERVTHDQMRTCGIAGLIAKPAEPRLIAAELRRTLDREARSG